jgi:hypothetical protein
MARYSIWVDSKSQFRRDPLGVIEALLWRSKSSLALSEHGARSSLYDEGKAIVKKHKATPEEVKLQLDQYRQDGIPDEKRFNGKKGVFLNSIHHCFHLIFLLCLFFIIVHFSPFFVLWLCFFTFLVSIVYIFTLFVHGVILHLVY